MSVFEFADLCCDRLKDKMTVRIVLQGCTIVQSFEKKKADVLGVYSIFLRCQIK